MILSDQDIKKAVRQGEIIIKPRPNWEKQLGSCSLDLRLAKSPKSKRVEYVITDRISSNPLFSLASYRIFIYIPAIKIFASRKRTFSAKPD